MPTLRIEMWSGRTLEQKRRLVQLVTNAVVEAVDVKPSAVQIKIFELEKHNAARGGVLRSEEQLDQPLQDQSNEDLNVS